MASDHLEYLDSFQPFLCADLLATLGAGVHVVALQCVFDGHLIQRFLKEEKPA